MREISIPGMQPGPIPMAGHVPGTDPATALALFADRTVYGDQHKLAVAIRAVLARLERAESIAVAATALVDAWETPFVTEGALTVLEDALAADLAEEVRNV